jgi:hypothetical protein
MRKKWEGSKRFPPIFPYRIHNSLPACQNLMHPFPYTSAHRMQNSATAIAIVKKVMQIVKKIAVLS